MTTKAFDKSLLHALTRNKSLPYEQKLELWSFVNRDWMNGENRKQPYIPFEAAEAIHKSMARFLIIAAGNRFAKSLIAGMEATACMCVPGTKTWIIGSQYSVCDHEFDYVEQALTKTDLWHVYIKNKIMRMLMKLGRWKKGAKKKYNFENHISVIHSPQRRIEIDWPDEPPSIIEAKSYNTDWAQLEGAKVSLMIFAEGSRVPKRLFEKHLRKRGSDMYARFIIPCTPKGRDSFLYPSYLKGLSSKLIIDIDRENRSLNVYSEPMKPGKYHVSRAISYAESYETFQYPGYENPYYNVDDYNAEVNELFEGHLDESIFRERNFGTFESLSGNFFMGIDEEKVFQKSFDLPENCTIYRAIDPGRRNQACCLWVAVQPWENDKFRYIVFRELYRSNMYLESFVEEVKKMSNEKVYYSVADPVVQSKTFSNKKPVIERMKDLGINPLMIPHKMPTLTIDRMRYWLPDLKDGRIVIFEDNCPNFKNEILECEYEDPKDIAGKTMFSDKLSKSSPQNALDAFSYLMWTKPQFRGDKTYYAHEAEKRREQPIARMSIAYILNKKSNRREEGMYGLLKEN